MHACLDVHHVDGQAVQHGRDGGGRHKVEHQTKGNGDR